MEIGYHEIAGKFLLHFHVIPDGTKIIPEVKEPCGSYPAHDYCIFHGGKDNIRMLP
jgi:hypothetical protein